MSLFSYVKYIGCMLMNRISYPTLDVVWKLAAASIGLAVLMKLALGGEWRCWYLLAEHSYMCKYGERLPTFTDANQYFILCLLCNFP